MARRTKADSEETRHKIIKQALCLFASTGVHQTTLEQIAVAAGVTRGAIYGHFTDKNHILQAIGEYTATTLKTRINNAVAELNISNPLVYLELYLQKVMIEIQSDQEIYQSLAILNCKCEYIEEYKSILNRIAFCYHEHIELFTNIYNHANAVNLLKDNLNPHELAIDTYAFLTGLIRLFFIEHFKNKPAIDSIITTHVKLRSR